MGVLGMMLWQLALLYTYMSTVVTLMLVGLLINPKKGDPFKNIKQLW